VGTQLLGLPGGGGAEAAAAPWWAERPPSALRRPRAVSAFELWPEGALAPAGAAAPAVRRGRGRAARMAPAARAGASAGPAGGAPAQEVGSMQTNRMKFLGVNGVLSGQRRRSIWFSLPGRWRLPSFQLMRRMEAEVERDLRGGFRESVGLGGPAGR